MSGYLQTELLIDFVNSLDLDPYAEAFETPAALVAWLVDRGLIEPGTRATHAQLDEAIRLREALRDLMGANNEVEADVDAAMSELDDAAHRARLGLCFRNGSGRLEPEAPGVRGALGLIVAEVSAAMTEGVWDRLKACRADGCRWAFYDSAKNRSRAWCSMSSCGNREKMRTYRERHAG